MPDLVTDTVEVVNSALKELRETVEKQKTDSDTLVTEKVEKIANDIEVKFTALEKAAEEQAKQMREIEKRAFRQPEAFETKEVTEKKKKNLEIFAKMISRTPNGQHIKEWSEADQKMYNEACTMALRKAVSPGEMSMKLGHQMSPEHLKTFQVGIDADGGYLVPPEYDMSIISRIEETSAIRKLADVRTTTRDRVLIPVDFDDIGSGWLGEGGSVAETDSSKFKQLEIPIHKAYAMPVSTTEELEDPAMDFESWLQNQIADKLARTQNTAFVTGDGIGKPKGFLSYAAGTAYGQVEQVTGATSAVVAWTDLFDLLKALKEGYHGKAAFAMPRTAWFNLLKENTSGSGELQISLGVNGTSLLDGSKPRFNVVGYGVELFQDMPAVASNSLSVALADWSRAYRIYDRRGISVLPDPYTGKGLVKFFATARVGGAVANSEAIKILKTKA